MTRINPDDQQDAGTIAKAARNDPRWRTVLVSATDPMRAAGVNDGEATQGLSWNGLAGTQFIGDFEHPDSHQGQNLKVTQVLWTARHLAAVAASKPDALDAGRIEAGGR